MQGPWRDLKSTRQRPPKGPKFMQDTTGQLAVVFSTDGAQLVA
jgi:hypothetical protein